MFKPAGKAPNGFAGQRQAGSKGLAQAWAKLEARQRAWQEEPGIPAARGSRSLKQHENHTCFPWVSGGFLERIPGKNGEDTPTMKTCKEHLVFGLRAPPFAEASPGERENH